MPASLAGSLPSPRRPGASFRLYLIGILLAALLPACLVGCVVVWQQFQATKAEARRGLDEQARTLALTVDAAINARIGLAVALAAMAANGEDPPVFGDQLRDVAARLGAGVFVYGPPPEIRPLANTAQPPGAALLPVAPGTGPADAVPRVFAEVRPQVGRAWFGPLSKAWVAAAFAPVLQGDSVAAAIAVGLDLPGLRHLLQRQPLRPGSTVLVLDHAGTIVARSDAQPPLVGEAAPDWAIRAGQPDAANGMVAIMPLVQARGWTVVVRDPAVGSGSWRRPAPPLAAATILGIAAGAWLALLLARRCLQPVEALTQRAAAISAGLPPDPEPPASGIREFSLLSTSLTAAHAALERQALAARQGQALLESVIEGTPDVLHVKGLDGRTIVANAAADAFFGVPRGGLVGRRSIALSRPAIVPVAEAHDAQVLRDGRTVTEEYRIADPAERVFKVTKAPLRQAADNSIAGLIILIQDVTQQRQMEAELRRAEGEMQRLGRRATAGAMASGLAHELNQPLTAATNYLRAADRLLDAGTSPDRLPVLQEAVRAAAEQTLRAGEIIRRLRDFVTRRDSAPVPEPVRAVIEEGVRLGLGVLQPQGLRFQLTLAEDLATVQVDRVAVQQVLVNLLRNAVEAMQGCERQALTVAAAVREEEGRRWLDIQVADTGIGVPRDVRDRLFEPFVSTKPDGMGVGLAICRRIVEAQGGTITAAAGTECGTVFTVTLPLAAGTAA